MAQKAEGNMGGKGRTIKEAIELIVSAVPGAPLEKTVDTVKMGDVSQILTGIATTFLATYDVIRRSIELGANLVITHEPTFYNHQDEVGWLETDPVYEAKRKLIRDHKIVVWRFHDYWHLYRPDGILTGVLRELGWEDYVDSKSASTCVIPPVSLSELVQLLKDRLRIRKVSVIGDSGMTCRRVGLLLGASGGRNQILAFEEKRLDVLLCGEINEWETSEYVRDAIDQGQKKALIILGHANSEEPGMKWLVNWLQPRLPDVRVTHLPAGDPFRFW
jgi:putative NIF3 family GTP cyclohydrolase 1 type 2